MYFLMAENIQQCVYIKFCQKLGKTDLENFEK